MLLTMTGLLSSCNLFDSGIEWRAGAYALLWIDTTENVSLCRDLGEGSWHGIVDSTVFAVGWDERYLVAKQHPNNDRSTTNYFIVDVRNNLAHRGATEITIGPITASEYQKRSVEMKLPTFSKVLDHLQ